MQRGAVGGPVCADLGRQLLLAPQDRRPVVVRRRGSVAARRRPTAANVSPSCAGAKSNGKSTRAGPRARTLGLCPGWMRGRRDDQRDAKGGGAGDGGRGHRSIEIKPRPNHGSACSTVPSDDQLSISTTYRHNPFRAITCGCKASCIAAPSGRAEEAKAAGDAEATGTARGPAESRVKLV